MTSAAALRTATTIVLGHSVAAALIVSGAELGCAWAWNLLWIAAIACLYVPGTQLSAEPT